MRHYKVKEKNFKDLIRVDWDRCRAWSWSDEEKNWAIMVEGKMDMERFRKDFADLLMDEININEVKFLIAIGWVTSTINYPDP